DGPPLDPARRADRSRTRVAAAALPQPLSPPPLDLVKTSVGRRPRPEPLAVRPARSSTTPARTSESAWSTGEQSSASDVGRNNKLQTRWLPMGRVSGWKTKADVRASRSIL